MFIYCCECGGDVEPRLTDGVEVYPHRKDLADLPFWKCDACGNYVGCHHKTKNRTRPLGCIPNAEIKRARQIIHRLIDPAWQTGGFTRKGLYKNISDALGYKFHTAEIKTVDQAREVYKTANKIITRG